MKLVKTILFIVIGLFLLRILLSFIFSVLSFVIIGGISIVCFYIGWKIFIR